MASMQKRNEDTVALVNYDLFFLCLRENMMNTKTAIRSDFQDRRL